MEKFYHHINGKEVSSSNKEWLDSINPFTTKPWALIPRGNEADVDQAVLAAHTAFTTGPWSKMGGSERGRLLCKVGELIEKSIDHLAKIEVLDNGKLLTEMQAQVSYLPKIFFYYGGLADKIEGSFIETDKPHMYATKLYEPLGVCVAITAWNSPLMLAAWKIAPALAAGNTVVMKPSEHASASTLAFAKLFTEANFPPGVVNAITGLGQEVGSALVTHPKVAKISFTGSVSSGRTVYQQAAQSFKQVTLELGGKSPNIVFPDANLDNALKGAISAIFAASGQTCIAGSRLLLHRDIHDSFVEKLVDFAKTAKMGDPLEKTIQVGPIATRAQYEKVLDYIQIGKEEGATCVLGGSPGAGWFIEPTIFTNVKNSMQIAQEEIFGPVLSIISFKDEDEAISIANDSAFGLAAGLWTEDPRKILELPKKISSGTVWVNTYRAFSTFVPFGGDKNSGIGRELGKEAIFDFLKTKSIWLNADPKVPDPFIMKI